MNGGRVPHEVAEWARTAPLAELAALLLRLGAVLDARELPGGAVLLDLAFDVRELDDTKPAPR